MVSIIIPIYNVGCYLRQCVDSILMQTFKDFEILLIDDGSTDGTSHLCDEISQVDTRIKVFHKTNGGLSDARNFGINQAKGEYIIFVDGDDYWDGIDSLMKLYDECLNNLDCSFIGFNCQYVYNNNKIVKWPQYSETTDKTDAISSLVGSGLFPMSACLKIIKRNFIIDNKLYFEKGRFSEDILWYIELIGKSEKFKTTNIYMYCYRQNVEGSITATFSEHKFLNLIDIINKGYVLINQLPFTKLEKQYLYSFLAYEFCILRGHKNKIRFSKNIQIDKKLNPLYTYMKYTKNPKVKLVHFLDNILGYRIVNCLLSKYLFSRR